MMRKLQQIALTIICLVALTGIASIVRAQQGFFTPEDVIKYTPDWHGERFPDGRPKVPDDILDRMKRVTLRGVGGPPAKWLHAPVRRWMAVHSPGKGAGGARADGNMDARPS